MVFSIFGLKSLDKSLHAPQDNAGGGDSPGTDGNHNHPEHRLGAERRQTTDRRARPRLGLLPSYGISADRRHRAERRHPAPSETPDVVNEMGPAPDS